MSDRITLSGLVSGLDTDALIAKLLQIESRPITLLQRQKSVLDTQNKALNAVNSKLLDFLSKLSPLLSLDTFRARSATSSDTSILTATATTSAIPGTHSVTVNNFATATKVSSTGIAGNTIEEVPTGTLGRVIPVQYAGFKVAPAGGTFTISHDAGAGLVSKTFTFNPATDSLQEIINAINAETPTTGVTASFDAAADTLVLTGNNANEIFLGSGGDTSNFFSFTNLAGGTRAVILGNFTVTSSPHLGGAKSNEVLTSTTTALTDPAAGPTLTSVNDPSGTLTPGDTFDIAFAAFNENGELTLASPVSTVAVGGADNAIDVSFTGVTSASGHLLLIRDVTAGEVTFRAVDLQGTSTRILSHTAGTETVPAANTTGGSKANFSTMPTAGTFTINGVSFTVGATDTLDTMINAINSSGAGVVASFDPLTDKFTLTNKVTGGQVISYANGTSNFFDVVKLSGAVQTPGAMASVTVDGTTYLRNSNSIGDILTGVTLSLVKNGGPVTLTIAQDTKPAEDAITKFVNAFNASEETIFSQSKAPVFDGTKKKQAEGPLFANFQVASVKFDLETLVVDAVPSLADPFDSLDDLGITLVRESGKPLRLEIDTAKLQSALATNPDAVSQIFSTSDGVATRMKAFLDPITTETGVPGIVEGNNRIIEGIDDRITVLQERLDKKEETLKAQFAQMEIQLAKLSQISAQLSQQISLMNAVAPALVGAPRSTTSGIQ